MRPERAASADRERGYALVAAVTAMAVFACIAFQVLASGRGGQEILAGRSEQTQLAAAADAGIAMALHGLGEDNPAARWSIRGRPRRVDFDGTDLTIVVEDERGKAPLAGLNDAQARALFAGAGAAADRVDALVAEFRDWQTDDVKPANGAPMPDPLTAPAIRHGPIATVGELIGLKDMDPGLLARIAPAVTVFFEESGPFEPRDASPLAITAMAADNTGAPQAALPQPDINSQTPDEEITAEDQLVGRTLTVRVTARAQDGAQTHRMAIVELTGDKARPFWIRYVE
jgi:general secretion pathway protein K